MARLFNHGHSPHVWRKAKFMRRVLASVTALVGLLTVGMVAVPTGVASANGPSCTTTCYVNATGSDSNDGATPATALATIQGAINAVSASGTVLVAPGTYNQDQANGYDPVTGGSGSNDFNIFVNKSITIQGTDSSGNPITTAPTGASPSNAPIVSANRYVPDFGASVIFVQADNVTIRGLEIDGQPNEVDKAVEVNGNNVTMNADAITPLGSGDAGIYLAPQTGSTTTQQSYSITNNTVTGVADSNGVPSAMYIANGSGASGPTSGRVISGNTFNNLDDAMDFAGPTTGTAWLASPVGTATITGNSFSSIARRPLLVWGNGGPGVGYASPDWCAILSSNTFDKATFLQTASGGCSNTPRTWSSGSFTNAAGIYSAIQRYGIGKAQPGDTLQVLPGTYNESLTIDKPMTLRGANAGVAANASRNAESVVQQTTGTSGVFNITTAGPVTIDGFTGTFTGTDAGGQVTVGGLLNDTVTNNDLTFQNNIVSGSSFNNALYYDTSAANSTLRDNEFTSIQQVGAGSTGIVATWGSSSVQANLDIEGNVFSGLTETTGDGTPAINVNDSGGTISGNTFTSLHQYGLLIADKLANLSIANNTFSGIYNDTSTTSQNRGTAIRTFGTPDFAGPVTVSGNTFTNVYHAVRVANDGSGATLNSNFTVNRNAFVGPFDGSGTGTGTTDSTAVSVASGTIGTLDATCNWWGQASGPNANQYDGSVTVVPSLLAASPLASAACGTPSSPAITSANNTTFVKRTAGTFTVTATGSPAPTFSETGLLPAGVTLNTAGLLSGTPTQSGTFPITVTASNGVLPNATQSFTLTVGAAPNFTSPNTTTFVKGYHGTFTVKAAGYPTAMHYTKIGTLPTGVTLSTAGVLSGTPTATGTFVYIITAKNGVLPNASQTFILHVVHMAITTTALPTATHGVSYTTTLKELGGKSPFRWTATGLPAGLTLAPTTGVISGRASTAGTYTVTITLTDSTTPTKNTASARLSLVVS